MDAKQTVDEVTVGAISMHGFEEVEMFGSFSSHIAHLVKNPMCPS